MRINVLIWRRWCLIAESRAHFRDCFIVDGAVLESTGAYLLVSVHIHQSCTAALDQQMHLRPTMIHFSAWGCYFSVSLRYLWFLDYVFI